jgi:type III secretion system YscQ/HrcQ family protein
MSTLKLRAGSPRWRTEEEARAEMIDAFLLPIHLRPLPHLFFFAIDRFAAAELASRLMNGAPGRSERLDALQEGFCRFLALHVLEALSHAPLFSQCAFALAESGALPSESMWTLPVAIAYEGGEVWGEVVAPKSGYLAWRQAAAASLEGPAPHSLSLPLTLQLVAGSTVLAPAAWKALEPGDVLLISHCSYRPAVKQGHAWLMLGATPLFQVTIDQLHPHLSRYADTYEEPPIMKESSEQPPENVSLQDLPLRIVVELGRLSIPLGKLMELEPGQVLDLPIHPQEVLLTVNGQPIGRGELVEIGETVGVRLLELSQ